MPRKKVEITPQSSALLEAMAEINKLSPSAKDDSQKDKSIVDIMEFCYGKKYLDMKESRLILYMSQKVILKCFYMGTRGNENLKLDEEEWKWLYDNEKEEERDGVIYKKNIDEVIQKILKREKENFNFKELILVLGRRGTKCRYENDVIATTEGTLTFRELCDRLGNGEKIGICTYNQNTWKRSVTYDVKAEDNGVVDCYKIKTKRGIREISSWNHPYLIWRDTWEKPKFVQLKDIERGDRVAVADKTELFGKENIGVNKAALLGHLQGDGGITNFVSYSSGSKKMIEDFRRLIDTEFPGYVVKYRSGYDYDVVKKSGRYAQNGSQKNEVKEWLKRENLFGIKSKNKRVPDSILKGSKREVASFLSRFFGCDGFCSIEKRNVSNKHGGQPKAIIGCALASEVFIDDIRHLLLKFGIHAVVFHSPVKYNNGYRDSWRLVIARKQDLETFQREITIFSKEKSLGEVVKRSKLRERSNSDFNNIPKGIWNRIFRLKENKNIHHKDLVDNSNGRLRRGRTLRRDKLLFIAKQMKDEYLLSVGESDIRWDVVADVKHVGKKQTVDLQVNPGHIIGGDIISHNTLLASVITAYEVYKLLTINGGDPHGFYGLPDDDEIAVINVALSQQQAGRLFGQIQARLRNAPFFKGRIAKETTSEIRLYTNQDLEKKKKGTILSVPGSILILCGHSNPDTLRGYSTILILFDELAHYDESGKVTGKKFYDALKPSLTQFNEYGDGRLVEISSPNAEDGIFYDIFKNSSKFDHILAFQLPTWCTNPKVNYDHEDLVADRFRNPESFAVEYGAQWSKSGTFGHYFPEELINRSVEAGVTKGVMPQLGPQPGFNYYMHIDPAKKGGRYVSVLVAKEIYVNPQGRRRIRVRLANVFVWNPEPGVGLLFNEIDKDVVQICSRFHPLAVTYDQYNSIHSLQLLKSHGINCIQTAYNRSFKNKIYQNLREMMAYHPESELWLYDEPRLILELKALKYRPTIKGIQFVVDKNSEIKTDDVIDCLAGAVAYASENVRMALPQSVLVRTGWI